VDPQGKKRRCTCLCAFNHPATGARICDDLATTAGPAERKVPADPRLPVCGPCGATCVKAA
jgi:hypothetical protein